MPPPVLVGWHFPAGVPKFWTAPRNDAAPPTDETPVYFIAKFTPAKPSFLQAASLLYYTPDVEDVAPPQEGLEGEPHFLAGFKPARLAVSPLLYQQRPDIEPPQSGTGDSISVISYRLYFPSPQASHLYYFQQPEFKPAVAETNTNFLAAFKPARLTVSPLLRFSFDQAQPPVTETNTPFLAGFNPAKLTVSPLLYQQQPNLDVSVVAAQPETNTHFLAGFKPVKLTVSPLLYQQQPDFEPLQFDPGDSIYVVLYTVFLPLLQATGLYYQQPSLDVPVVVAQPETNTHFLAGFKPVKLTVSPLLRFSFDQAQPPVTETNTHFVAKFKQTPTWRFAYNSWDQSQPPVAETNVHFIGTFRPVKLCISPLLRQHYQTDLSASAVATPPAGDNISVISYRVYVASPQASSLYYFQQPTPDPTAVVVQPTTNQHYLARFNPARITVSSLYRQHGQEDALPPVVETNVHTIGRFTSVRLVVPAFLRQHYPGDLTAGFIPQEPFVANSHYLATFKQTKLLSFAYNSTDTGVAQAETNVHFIGRFRQVSTWRFNYNTRADDPAVVETNTHFVARFTAAQLKRFSFNSWDTGVPQVETNPHHVGRFTPAKCVRFNYNTRGDDSPVVETNPHQIGSFRPTKIIKLALLWNNPAADIFVAEPPGRVANPHFVGRFAQPKFLSFRFNTPDTQVPPIPEFWITAGARNLTATDAERALVATDQQRHLTATDTGRNLIATGSARNRIATWN